jgi:hypothetical protein
MVSISKFVMTEEQDIKEKRALGHGLSDIGRFSLPEANLEGIRQSRTRERTD